jgi:hypothetical protein
LGFLFFSSQTVFRFFPCKTTTQQQQQLFYAEINTLHSCFFSFFLPSETPFTSFTKEKQQKRQQLLVFMQRRFEILPLLLPPLKLFPHYSPKNTNQEQLLLYAKKIKTFASSSASSSQTIFHIIHQKTPTKNNNNNFFMQRRSKHLLLLLLLLPPPPLTLSSHPSQNNTNKSSNSNFGFRKIQNLSFSSFSPRLSSHPNKKTPTTTTATSLCKRDQN